VTAAELRAQAARIMREIRTNFEQQMGLALQLLITADKAEREERAQQKAGQP